VVVLALVHGWVAPVVVESSATAVATQKPVAEP